MGLTQIKHVSDGWDIVNSIMWEIKGEWTLGEIRFSPFFTDDLLEAVEFFLGQLEIKPVSLIFRLTCRKIANKSYQVHKFDGLTFNM